MEVVVEAEVDAAAEVALLVEAEAMLVIEPTLAENGRAMMLSCLQRLPQMVALENITEMEHGLQILRVEYHPYN
jgi:hypothetical protein